MPTTKKTKTKTTKTPRKSAKETEKPIILYVRPGSTAEKLLKIVLPNKMEQCSNIDAIEYVLNLKGKDFPNLKDNEGRKRYARIQERIRNEMAKEYTITINGVGARPQEPLSKYLVDDTSPKQTKVRIGDIVVASGQSGMGFGLEYSV